MTVENANSRNDYVSNGSAVDYAFTFKILTAADIQVVVADLDGVEDILTLTTDYTVTLDADTGLGEITLNTAVTSGYTISLLRNLDFEQNTAIQNQGTSQFSGYSFERALDKLTLMALQLRESLARSILLPKSSQLTELEIPVNVANAGKAIFVNAEGDNLDVKNLADIDAAVFSDLGLELVASETAAAMRSSMSAQELADNLTALAGLTGASGKVPYFTGEGEIALSDLPMGKNAVLNGDFELWMAGTSFAAIGNGTTIAETWRYDKVGSMEHTISRSADVPTVAQAGRRIPYSLKIECTTIDASIAAGDYCNVQTRIEGYRAKGLFERTFTVSFWFKATKIGVYCCSVNNGGFDRSHSKEFTVNASDTWEFKTVSFTESPTDGTWDYETGIGMVILFALACGSTFQTTADAWNEGNFIGTSNQVNACDSTSNGVYIASVQAEAGSVATPFEITDYQDTFRSCKRYYQTAGAGWLGNQESTTTFSFPVQFESEMRASPSLSLISSSITARTFSGGVADLTKTDCALLGTTTVDPRGAWVYLSNAASGSAGQLIGSRNGVPILNLNARLT